MKDTDWDLKEFADGAAASRIGRTSSRLTIFLAVLLAMFVGGVLWASWAVVEEVARAGGQVVPSGRARTVESLEGGIVREINVREGDVVSAGDVLVRIDDTGSAANLGELQAQKQALTARSIRLEAEAIGSEELDFSGTTIAPDSPLALREIALFNSRLASYFGQRAVVEAQVAQRQQDIHEISLNIQRADETLALLDEEIELRADSGVVSRAQIIPTERERIAKRQERDSSASRLASAKVAVNEAEARLVELELNRKAEISTERSDTMNQLSVINESLIKASDIVSRANLRAPVDGIISSLNVNTLGSVIAPGEEVLRVVPLDDFLQVEARARPEDIAFMRPGLPARVKLTSFDFTIYGALDAKVERVGADAEKDETTGEVYFPVIVVTDETTLEHEGQAFDIRPGMVASVDIITGERTVLEYLLKPFQKARFEALRER
ncbi:MULTISPECIES: HlyD family type I secretion periplasmic adaptor subunit [Halocynthiibacter]|uniref:Membrane fusion protein (MFP) family protein n=1 Tax=Halocynthiibacter halioticoli TaxID=2986804 RepID=A0AAE3IZF8_9RHOB|nr:MULTISPECIES: HlyD family type I secretion periplasmic adaptor subunit [Halocynthiibacter]MCV6825172.1 HlyD family type I secretion periplasmic adaptor subunit [Halocynthiibacter halioticoli]MCW4058173.1 HlyD family type I secretion periplasmic adaptor subunit [Halocynthiibacter sp. SDUM655004]